MKTGINDHRLRFRAVAAITLAGLVAGCGNGIPQEAQPRTPVENDQDSSTNSSAATEAPKSTETTETTDPAPTTIPPVDLPADRAAVFADLAQFWSANADAMGVSEIPSIDMDRVQPWRQDAILCEEESILVEDVAANAAAFACTEGGAIVWAYGLLAEIAGDFGSATTYGVFAHAYGHYVAWLVDPETRLARGPFLLGTAFTAPDIRLFVTLVRFDAAYHGLFKCNLRRLAEYANLTAYLKRLLDMPGVRDTVNIDHIKKGY